MQVVDQNPVLGPLAPPRRLVPLSRLRTLAELTVLVVLLCVLFVQYPQTLGAFWTIVPQLYIAGTTLILGAGLVAAGLSLLGLLVHILMEGRRPRSVTPAAQGEV